ncbi:MAG TPA: CPBP family intramembrane glutamic endopeptidase [Methylomirabilota bacterium]|nr:CPBP family intramembrane glutamic endopeptidase [Methylomirabilota bacterium]
MPRPGALSVVSFYLIAVFIGGAAVAPLLHKAVLALAPHSTLAQTLVGEPFHRYVARAFMVIAILGLWPLFRSLDLRSLKEAGLEWEPASRKQLLLGLVIGLGSLAPIALGELIFGIRSWDSERTTSAIQSHLLNAVLAAILVGFLEEVIFRSGIFGGLRKGHSFLMALVVSSALYALVHFFERATAPEKIDFASGFVVLGRMCRGFTDIEAFLPAFLNLWLAGAALALAYQNTGTIWLSVGLHGGWIFWLKTFSFFTRSTQDSPAPFWGTAKLIDGWAAFIVLLVLVFLFWRKGANVRPASGSIRSQNLA